MDLAPGRALGLEPVNSDELVSSSNAVNGRFAIFGGDSCDKKVCPARFQCEPDLVEIVRIRFSLCEPVNRAVRIVNGEAVGLQNISTDPADHRDGIFG